MADEKRSSDRLTRWEGQNPDGSPRAVLVAHDGPFAEILQPALAKLAELEDLEREGDLRPVVLCRDCRFFIRNKDGTFCYAYDDAFGWTDEDDFCSSGCGRYLE